MEKEEEETKEAIGMWVTPWYEYRRLLDPVEESTPIVLITFNYNYMQSRIR